MRPILALLLCSSVLAVGCAQRSDSLYQPIDNTVSDPSSSLGDPVARDREYDEEARRAREEALQQQRDAREDSDDGDD